MRKKNSKSKETSQKVEQNNGLIFLFLGLASSVGAEQPEARRLRCAVLSHLH